MPRKFCRLPAKQATGKDKGTAKCRNLILIAMTNVLSIRRKRREFALSELELADLLGLSEARVCRLEQREVNTRLRTAFGLQVIFAAEPRELFPRTFAEVEEAVMRRAAKLDETLREQTDPISIKKHRLLAAMVERAESATGI